MSPVMWKPMIRISMAIHLQLWTYTVAGVAGTFVAGATATIPAVGILTINTDVNIYVLSGPRRYNGSVPQATYTITDGTATASSTLDITIDPGKRRPGCH